MSRPIKFRAYDIMTKLLSDPFTLSDKQIFKGEEYICDRSDLGTDDFIIMQFTGLLDKNGNEIYEDDILGTKNDNKEFDIWTYEEAGYTQVIWDNKNSCFKGTHWTWELDNQASIYDLSFVEVCGSIFENPELLNQ